MEVHMAYYKCHRDGIPHPVDTSRRLNVGEIFKVPAGSIPIEDFANGFFEALPDFVEPTNVLDSAKVSGVIKDKR